MELSYILLKKAFLIFREMKLSSTKLKKFQEGTFRLRKIKKPTLKKFLILRGVEPSSLKLKKLLYFRRKFTKPKKQKFLLFWKIEVSSSKI